MDFLSHKENFIFSPTPIHKLNNLSQKYNQNIYIKRDDLTGLAMGGNKARKLEYLIYQATSRAAKTVITTGAPQSNHCRQTVAACKLYNLNCILVLIGKIDKSSIQGNILLEYLMGCETYFFDEELEAKEKIEELIKNDEKSYFIQPGGSNEYGACGYIDAYREILEDEKKLNLTFDIIVFASSSLGTQTGLILGNKLFGNSSKKIHGISICKKFLDSAGISDFEKIKKIGKDFSNTFNVDVEINDDDIIYDERFNEKGYAIVSDEDIFALKEFASNDAIILDPVYSGRAAAGLLFMLQNGEFPELSNILFIHTGGQPALFTDLLNQKMFN